MTSRGIWLSLKVNDGYAVFSSGAFAADMGLIL